MAFEGEIYGEDYFTSTYPAYFRQNPARKLEFYRSIVERNMPTHRPVRVLDIGCGLAGFLACLRERDPNRLMLDLTGVDLSEFAIRTNTAKYPNEKFAVCRAEDVAEMGQTFDVVTAFDILEHLQDPDQAADAISRSLSAEGTCIFVVPVYDGPLGPLVRLLDKDETHVQLRSRRWWLDWASGRFTVTGWQGVFRLLTPWHQYIHAPTRALRRIAPAVLITATNRRT